MSDQTKPGHYTLCEECGVQVFRYLSQRPARWCSWECRTIRPRAFNASEQVSLTCLECGVTFKRLPKKRHQKFCGPQCFHTYNGRGKRKAKVVVECRHCGIGIATYPSVVGRKKFCSRRCAALGRPIGKTSKIADDAIAIWSNGWSGANFVAEYRVDRWSLDIAFPEQLIAIELDGVYWHSLAAMIDRDERKDAALSATGWSIRRITITKDMTAETLADSIGHATKDLQWTRC